MSDSPSAPQAVCVRRPARRSWLAWGSLALAIGWWQGTGPAGAADKVLVRYAPIEQSVSVPELRAFADTGKTSNTLDAILTQTKLDPDTVRAVLSSEFDLEEFGLTLRLAERLLNTYIAELLLREVGRVAHPPRVEAATVKALRGAIVQSLSDDSKITAIEFLEKYPTDLVVEGNLIEEILNRILKDIEDLQDIIPRINERANR